MKGFSAFLKDPVLLEPHNQVVLVSYPGHLFEKRGLTPRQKISRCILQPKPTRFLKCIIRVFAFVFNAMDLFSNEKPFSG